MRQQNSWLMIWISVLLHLIQQTPTLSQQTCSSRQFVCTNGQCILREQRCDGKDDCADKSDENCCVQNSNSGTEFMLAFLSNHRTAPDPNLVLFLTSAKSVNYTIQAPSQAFRKTGSIEANELQQFEIPSSFVLLTSGIENKGILVTSTEEMTVYGLNQVRHTTDAFLALPTSVQGHEYVVAAYTELTFDQQRSLLAVVGIRDNTRLTILLSSNASDGNSSFSQGDKVSYTINRFQTLQLTGFDLSGTIVYSDQPVSVFGGHQCAYIPSSTVACDHLVEQLPPVSTFGQRFATVPLATRIGGDIFRVLAAKDGTDVLINGIVQASINAGEFYEIDVPSSRYLSVETTQPVLFLQYSKGQNADGVISDPFMAMIPPVEQYRSHYIISTPPASPATFASHVNLVIEHDEISGLRLDDQPLPSGTEWHAIPGQSLVGTSIPVSVGVHRIHHVRRAKFGLLVYGYGSYDSFGYPGGLQLAGKCKVDSTVIEDKNECEDQHPCQHICINTFGSFLCACRNDYILQPDLKTCKATPTTKCNCSSNGICRSGGPCLCLPGWDGPTCNKPACRLRNACSGHGECVAPNKCQCSRGWVGSSCSVNVCPHYTSCASCTANSGCGWCETQRRCMSGTGTGPEDNDQRCPAWFFYHCVTMLIDTIPNVFPERIHTFDCDRDCVDDTVQNRGNSLDVPGSPVWCNRWRRACTNFQQCFTVITNGHCTREDASETCVVPSEPKCPGGVPPIAFDDEIPFNDAEEPQPVSFQEPESKETVLDFSFHIHCATFQAPDEWANYGCYCVNSKSVEGRVLKPRSAVDPTDLCCEERLKCYSKAPKKCDCHSTVSIIKTKGCSHWENARGFCKDLLLINRGSQCMKYCCECDFKGSLCIANQLSSKNYGRWRNWLDVSKGQCTQNSGTVPNCPINPVCSGHGVLDGAGNDAFCMCLSGWKGSCCEQPDCECTGEGTQDCSGNGACLAGLGDSKPRCSCRPQWEGKCCQRRVPIRTSGDPHLISADGLEFDYFGIGEFWECKSPFNGFGVQVRFFKYKGTSFAGAVAIKTGNVTTSIISLGDSKGSDSLPKTRIATYVLSDQWHDYPITHFFSSDGVKVYIQPTKDKGSLVSYLFQFHSGASYSVDVRYSSMIGRQYINTQFVPTASFIQRTEGLCGYMDDDVSNDLTGPNGLIFNNTDSFAESWRVDQTLNNSGDGSWSWMYSNFHPEDLLDFFYTDASHKPNYGISQLDDTIRLEAETLCRNKGLSNTLLDNCVLDVGLTGDTTVVEQQAFQQGKCPNDCSNHGQCSNGNCTCISGWTGEDCSQGGCESCPVNSQCIDGFCQCNVGYFSPECAKATCDGVNNCTSFEHGQCIAENQCKCRPGYLGADCSTLAICEGNCSNHGTCTGSGNCLCHFGWGGDICNKKTCEPFNFCSENGYCNENGTCECYSGWHGSSCSLFSCSEINDCYGNGECVGDNQCQCFLGYQGAACNESTSCNDVLNCSNNGVCRDEKTCVCFSGYYGDKCENFECTRGCSGRGTCVAPDLCSCNVGWTGDDCAVPSCQKLHYCSGHGSCVGLDSCVCDSDWSGLLCDTFTCNSGNRTGNCSSHGTCVSPGQCSCDQMYCGDDCQFPVVDECSMADSPCDQTCADTCESFECSCGSGYLLLDDKTTCQDIDECNTTASYLRLNNCDQICENVPGSYLCNCTKGYNLDESSGTCTDIDECVLDTPCDQLCHNTGGSYNCSCLHGYMLNNDSRTCEDIDECSLEIHNCTDAEVCSNTLGSYACHLREITFRWQKSRWSRCSKLGACRFGSRTRRVSCIETNLTSGTSRVASDAVCVSLVPRKPKDYRSCGRPCRYKLGDWSICGSDCMRRRDVKCVKVMKRGREKPMLTRHCNAAVDIPLPRPPPNEESCSGGLCSPSG